MTIKLKGVGVWYDFHMQANLEKLARLIRYFVLLQTSAAQSGHATSSLSAVELMTLLYFKYLRFDLEDPKNPRNDRVILSKGHASPLFYALYAAAGKITEEELKTYRTLESVLEGHPTPRFPFTEAVTGSLGQGLSIGIGEALALRQLTYNLPKVYVLLGDGEMASGNIWEAIAWAGFKKLNNLIAILDVNRLGQSEQTMLGHDPYAYAKRVASFGWRTYIVEDGHDLDVIDKAYSMALEQSNHSDMPALLVAKTIKGKGVPFWEDKNGWHSKPVPRDQFEEAVKGLGEIDTNLRGKVLPPDKTKMYDLKLTNLVNKGESQAKVFYDHKELVATKKAFGNALERLGSAYPSLVVLDGDVKNSLHTDQFEKKYPDRFLQMYIAEQNLVCVAWGLATRGFKPFVTTFGCFLTRAHDQFRLAQYSNVTLYVNSSYAGVSIGKDGPSQMGLDDMAMFRGLFNSTVLYPADAYATERLVEEMLKREGIVMIRTTREPTPIIYDSREEFKVGGSKEFAGKEDVTVVAAGITVHEALKAQKALAKEGIRIRVVDCYSIKPIDVETLKKAAAETKAIITVEDHSPVGGLGDAVLEVFADSPSVPVFKLAVTKIPRSGKPDELLEYEEISAQAIVRKVHGIMK